MTVTTEARSYADTPSPVLLAEATPIYLDPLEPDQASDPVVTVTERSLARLALVACETASRFQREGVPHDPMAWMLAPRRLFGGRRAIEAALDRDDCLRAVLMHGLALGLDAAPGDIDELTRGEGSGLRRRSRRNVRVGAEVGLAAVAA